MASLDNEDASAEEIALTYKREAGSDRDFRDIKSFYDLRPLHHRKKERIEGHVFVCVLAKACECELRRRMPGNGCRGTSVVAVLEEMGRIRAARLQAQVDPTGPDGR